MSARELEVIGAARWGWGWKGRMAKHLGVDRKTITRWLAAGRVPDWALIHLRDPTRAPLPDRQEAMSLDPPPPPDRSAACTAAMALVLDEVLHRAERAGWTRAEALAGLAAAARDRQSRDTD